MFGQTEREPWASSPYPFDNVVVESSGGVKARSISNNSKVSAVMSIECNGSISNSIVSSEMSIICDIVNASTLTSRLTVTTGNIQDGVTINASICIIKGDIGKDFILTSPSHDASLVCFEEIGFIGKIPYTFKNSCGWLIQLDGNMLTISHCKNNLSTTNHVAEVKALFIIDNQLTVDKSFSAQERVFRLFGGFQKIGPKTYSEIQEPNNVECRFVEHESVYGCVTM